TLQCTGDMCRNSNSEQAGVCMPVTAADLSVFLKIGEVVCCQHLRVAYEDRQQDRAKVRVEGNIERLPEDVVHVPAESDVPRVFGDVLIDVAVAVHLDQIELGFWSCVLPFVFDRLAKFREESGQPLVAGEAEGLIAEQVPDRGDRLDIVADVARTNARLIVAE